MNLFKKKHIYLLMHKEIPVFRAEYSFHTHEFLTVTKLLHPEHLPFSLYTGDKLSMKRLNTWWKWRGIPSYRVGLPQLQSRLGIHDPLELLEREHALSVSDTYWLKEEKEDCSFEDINFFDHSFDEYGFGMAMFSQMYTSAPSSARHTPNNVTCGYHRKAWFHRSDNLYLLKGGTPFYQQEPIQEWLAYQIALQLGFKNVTPYATEIYENNIVSVCPAFTNKDVDLLTTGMVIDGIRPPKEEFHLPYYIKALEEHGISNAKQNLEHMLLLDYLMMNSDRHNQNLGILVDANTNQWLSCAPVFDTGTGLGCLEKDEDVLPSLEYENCKLLNARNFNHDALLDYINLKNYDFTNLEKLPQIYANKLVQYQPISNITNRRIEAAYTVFYKRILRLKKYASQNQ